MSAQPERRADVVPLHPVLGTAAEVAPPIEQTARPKGATGSLKGVLERYSAKRIVPTRAGLVSSAKWWSTTGVKAAGLLLLHLPYLAARELKPVARGVGRAGAGWAKWCAAAPYAETVKSADGNDKAKHAERVEARKEGRRRLSLAVLVVLIGLTWWVVVVAPASLLPAGLLLLCVFDAVGRRGKADAPLRAAKPTVLAEGLPLRQLTASILDVLEREGIEASVESPMAWDQGRLEYRVRIASDYLIEPKHLRAVERVIGAADYAIRLVGTDTATIREMIIRRGDPLENVPSPAWVDTGSRSVVEPAVLGVSVTDIPFALSFAGVHVAIVAMTGGGKTKALLWAIINALSACGDCVLWGIDLAHGPALPMWRGVLQRTAYTIEDAEQLLDDALVEIDRRMVVLTEIAEDDDPDNDTDEWHPGLGPALVIVIDEFSIVADLNNLLRRTERIIRTGRKVWVTLIMGSQKAGNSDFGSTVMSTQVGVKILGACSERDTTTVLGTELRDLGWAPHHLQPAVEGDVRDAGKFYVWSPAHRTPDIYRAFAPLRPGEVKQRARQRIADGLPRLGSTATREDDAAVVPAILAAVERAFHSVGTPDFLPTRTLLEWLRANHDPGLNEARLAEQLAEHQVRPSDSRRRIDGSNPLRGYAWADVDAALRRL